MVPFCAPFPCYILSWWRMSRASCGATGRFSIYIVPSRLLRLAFASRVGVPWRLLVYCVSSVLLVSSSRRRLLIVASCRFIFSVLSRFCPCVLLVADAGGWAMSSVGRLMSVASRRECLASFLRLVSRLVSSSRSHSSRFALVVIRGVRRGGRNVAGMSLSSCGYGGGVLFPYF